GQLGRRLRGEDADAYRDTEVAPLAQVAEATEGVEVGAVVAPVGGPVDPVGGEQRGDRGVLAAAAARPQLEDLAPPARFEAAVPRAPRQLVRPRLGGRFVFGAAPMKRLDRALVLAAQLGAFETVASGEEFARLELAADDRRIGLGLGGTGEQQLEAVIAG